MTMTLLCCKDWSALRSLPVSLSCLEFEGLWVALTFQPTNLFPGLSMTLDDIFQIYIWVLESKAVHSVELSESFSRSVMLSLENYAEFTLSILSLRNGQHLIGAYSLLPIWMWVQKQNRKANSVDTDVCVCVYLIRINTTQQIYNVATTSLQSRDVTETL